MIFVVFAKPQNFWGNSNYNSYKSPWLSPPSYNLYYPYQQYSSRHQSENPYQSYGSYQSSADDFASSYEPKLSRYSSPPVLDGQFTNQDWPITSHTGNSRPQSYDNNQYSSGVSYSYQPGITQNESPHILSGQFIDYQGASLNGEQTYNRNSPIRYLIIWSVRTRLIKKFTNLSISFETF